MTEDCWPAHPRGRDVIAYIDTQFFVRDLDSDGMPRHPAPPGFKYEWEFAGDDAWLKCVSEHPGSNVTSKNTLVQTQEDSTSLSGGGWVNAR